MIKDIQKAAKLARIALTDQEIPAIEQAFAGLMEHFEHLGAIEAPPEMERKAVRLREDVQIDSGYQMDWESRETKDQALVIPRVMD
jgi:Asp-tRNA(Asn)/Glu-tRNA(Gln) amidotransferase C subunit